MYKNRNGNMRGQKLQGFGRPRTQKHINCCPKSWFFKPRGIKQHDLEVINVTKEEIEALRLKNIENLDQTECAKRMKTSQSTFQRILSSAYKKVSSALVEGKAIQINDE